MSTAPFDAVVVGGASRDLTADDPRGWRLGGAVTYASLTLARLGLRVRALAGVDAAAASATELQLLREAGVALTPVPLATGPVFENLETPTGRVQRAAAPSDRVPIAAAALLPADARDARGWFLGPVAGELGDEWADVVPRSASVALGWQGLLRTFAADGTVRHLPPAASPLVRRAALVGVGQDDLASSTDDRSLADLLAPEATLLVTRGRTGGIVVDPAPPDGGPRPLRRYPAIASASPVDATGAGDAFLAALFAARLEPRLVGGRGRGFDLLLAAAVASLSVEGHGLAAIPTRSAVRSRMREGMALLQPRGEPG